MSYPLRVEVAEKVLGYEIQVIKPDWYQYDVLLFIAEGQAIYTWDENGCNAMIYADELHTSYIPPLPFFEDDLRLAWEVVEAMKDNELFRYAIERENIWQMFSGDAARTICEVALIYKNAEGVTGIKTSFCTDIPTLQQLLRDSARTVNQLSRSLQRCRDQKKELINANK